MRKFSAERLKARISTLRRRHRAIDAQVQDEQARPLPDTMKLKSLKQERLGLKHAIHVTHAMLDRVSARQSELA